MVSFEITTAYPLPVGQQVFISGNIDMLGNWEADGLPLTRMDDNVWTSRVPMPGGVDLEFKITKGSWSTEEIDEKGRPLKNNHVLPRGEAASFKHTVLRWKDDVAEP